MRSASTLLVMLLVAGCSAAADGEPGEEFEQPEVAYEQSSPTEPARDNGSCTPDIAYEIEGQVVVVPGYCPERRLERPTIGDPDPSNGLDDVLYDHDDGY